MTNTLKQTLWLARAVLAGGTCAAVLGAIVGLTPIYGPRIEAAVAPVLEPAPSPIWRGEDGSVMLNLWVYKRRGECQFFMGSASYQFGDEISGWKGLSYTRPGHTGGPAAATGCRTSACGDSSPPQRTGPSSPALRSKASGATSATIGGLPPPTLALGPHPRRSR